MFKFKHISDIFQRQTFRIYFLWYRSKFIGKANYYIPLLQFKWHIKYFMHLNKTLSKVRLLYKKNVLIILLAINLFIIFFFEKFKSVFFCKKISSAYEWHDKCGCFSRPNAANIKTVLCHVMLHCHKHDPCVFSLCSLNICIKPCKVLCDNFK